ncbi:MAG: YcgN family cysteine cluster protein [Mariprofundaceae bacterium]
MNRPFWQQKTLTEMSQTEWESLCDGCGRCCLIKFEDMDSQQILFTDVACKLLDTESCRCTAYAQRKKFVPSCLSISLNHPEVFDWLPNTCAYRLLFHDKPLPAWHPLLTGDESSTHKANISIRGKCISESETNPKCLEQRITHWVE